MSKCKKSVATEFYVAQFILKLLRRVIARKRFILF